MRRVRDFYFLLFYFWFRLDLLTKRREDKALKALGAVTVVQVWLVLGSYTWGEILLGLPSPTLVLFLGTVAALLLGNYVILRRRGWEEFERRFAQCSASARRGWMALAAAASIAAFGVALSAGIVSRSGR